VDLFKGDRYKERRIMSIIKNEPQAMKYFKYLNNKEVKELLASNNIPIEFAEIIPDKTLTGF
jgi:hypothetical protein